MPQSNRTLREIITALTVTVLFAVILALVVFAARGYQHSAELQDDAGNTRAVLSYVTSSVRDSGSSEISVAERAGHKCIVISGEGYEQRFYLDEGRLLEEYTEPEAGLNPATALEIGTTDTFDAEIDGNGILTVRTDSGTASVNTGRKR